MHEYIGRDLSNRISACVISCATRKRLKHFSHNLTAGLCILLAAGCFPRAVGPPETGSHIEKYRSGMMKVASVYRNGLLHGPYTEWYANGVKKMTVSYVEGNMEGLCQAWDANGRLQLERPMSNGFAHGDARFYIGDTPMTIHFEMGHAARSDASNLIYRNDRPWQGTQKVYLWEKRHQTQREREIRDGGGFVDPDLSRYEQRVYSQGRLTSAKYIDEEATSRWTWWLRRLLWF